MTEFLQSSLSRYHEPTDDDRGGEEGDNGVESLTVEQHITIDAFCVFVERVIALNDTGDEHNKCDHDEDIDGDECPMEDLGPAYIRMTGSYNPLSKKKVDNEEQDHSNCNEDVGRYRYLGTMLSKSPDDAHDHGGGAGHAETEHHAGHDEFVASSLVDLEDGHVGDGAEDEKEHEDCGNWDIEGDGGKATQTCGGRWIGRSAHGGSCGTLAACVLENCLAGGIEQRPVCSVTLPDERLGW